jgi:hypothetical protein
VRINSLLTCGRHLHDLTILSNSSIINSNKQNTTLSNSSIINSNKQNTTLSNSSIINSNNRRNRDKIDSPTHTHMNMNGHFPGLEGTLMKKCGVVKLVLCVFTGTVRQCGILFIRVDYGIVRQCGILFIRVDYGTVR